MGGASTAANAAATYGAGMVGPSTQVQKTATKAAARAVTKKGRNTIPELALDLMGAGWNPQREWATQPLVRLIHAMGQGVISPEEIRHCATKGVWGPVKNGIRCARRLELEIRPGGCNG